MTFLILSSFIKSFMIIGFLGLLIFLALFAENLVTKILSKSYGSQIRLNPFYPLIKLFTKRESVPDYAASPLFFRVIPFLNFIFALLPVAVIPWCEPFLIYGVPQNSEVFGNGQGVLIFFALSSLAILTVLWSGWLAQKNVTILSSMRAAYREISCKIPLLMIVFSMILFYRSSDLNQIILIQDRTQWGILQQPLAALIFFVALLAEIGKAPFDTAENFYELNGGYLSEYGGSQTFFLLLAEYVNLVIFSIIFIHLFLGGYHILPGLEWILQYAPGLLFTLQTSSVIIKILILVVLYTILKLAIPRYRHEDLLAFGQKGLLPLSFINLLVVIAGQYYRTYGSLF